MITRDEILSKLNYSPVSGIFTWKAGKIAGSICKDRGYRYIRINKVLYVAHRLAWIVIYGSIPDDRQIDHKNGKRDDNRKRNLRLVINQQNAYNMRKSTKNTSGVKGVCRTKSGKRWRAYLRVKGVHTTVGYFNDIGDAEKAVIAARKLHHGEYANHGKLHA